MAKSNGLLFGGLLALGAGALIFGLSRKAKNLEALQIGLDSGSIDTVKTDLIKDPSSIYLKIRLSVYNPNEQNVLFDSFNGNVEYKGTNAINIDPPSGSTPFSFIARKSTILPLSLKVKTTSVGVTLIDVILKLIKKQPVAVETKVRLTGTLHAQGLAIPIDETFDLKQ